MDRDDRWTTGQMANPMFILYERFYIFCAKAQSVSLVTGLGSKAGKNTGNQKEAILPFKI